VSGHERPDGRGAGGEGGRVVGPKEEPSVKSPQLLPTFHRAARGLWRARGFSALCVLTLAVGIGADTAVFSIVDAVLLRPLPYPAAERLVDLHHTIQGLGLPRAGLSDATYLLYKAQCRSLRDLALVRGNPVNVSGTEAPVRVPAAVVTPSLFKVLRVHPRLGRPFADAEGRPGGSPVVIVSDSLWRRQLGGDPAAVSRTLRIDGVVTQVVGVMPAGFAYPDLDTALWLPLRIDPAKTELGALDFHSVGRLAAGATIERAAADLNSVARALDRWLPGEDAQLLAKSGLTVVVQPLRDEQVGKIGQALWVLFGAVGCILAIACANVANLLIVRGEGRQREQAIQSALGSSRRRLIGAVLAESLLLGLAAGLAGLALTWGGVRLLAALRPAALARVSPASVDGRVLVFALLLSVLTSLLFGLVPAWRASRQDELAAELQGGGRALTQGRGRRRLRQVLVGLQLALALVLLTGSGLMLRSFRHLAEADPGFDPQQALTFEIALPRVAWAGDAAPARLFGRVLDRVAALPGVTAVGATSKLPLTGLSMDGFMIEDHPRPAKAPPPVLGNQYISDGYFRAMRIPLIAGRWLERADAERRTGAVVVSASLARHYWPQGALGKRLRSSNVEGPSAPWYTIVGVAGDVRQADLIDRLGEEMVYYPLVPRIPGEWEARQLTFVVRAALPPAALAAAIRHEIGRLAPDVPIANLQLLDEVVHRSRSRVEFSALLIAIATAVALILGAVGLYGFVSYLVGQRTPEIGIRMALGASPRTIRWMVLREALVIAGGGLALGLAAAAALSGSLAALLVKVSPLDPLAFATAPLLLVTVTLFASYLPAERAARVAPSVALQRLSQ
jgi:putative ABC transport system permease protein